MSLNIEKQIGNILYSIERQTNDHNMCIDCQAKISCTGSYELGCPAYQQLLLVAEELNKMLRSLFSLS